MAAVGRVVESAEQGQLDAQILARRAQFALNITRTVARMVAVVTLLPLILWLFFRAYTQLLVFAGLIVLVGVVALLYPGLHRQGRAPLGIRLFILSTVLAIVMFPLLVPELLLSVVGDYVILIAMTYLLLGDRDSLWVGLACGLAFAADFVMVDVLAFRLFAPLEGPIGPVTAGLFVLVVLVLAAMVIRLIIKGQEESLRQAQIANMESSRLAAAEREQRQLLQQANQETATRAAAEQEQRESLQRVLGQVREAVGQLSSSSAEILTATTQQAAGASEQSAAITQASATIDEVRTIATQNAERAQGVAAIAQRTADVSRTGQQASAETIAGMGQVKHKVETIATNILSLSEQAQAVGQIITTVSEIAAQSNMLALNASVEAARAGEAGKGFAVVAGEVRSLAEQSRAATVQVKEILTEIQRGVNAAVMATEEGMKGTDVGMKLAGESGLAIQGLAENVSESAQAALQIATAAGQQVAGMEQITLAMQNIHQVTGQTISSTRQSEKAAEELNKLAGQLRQVVEQYHL